MAHRERKRYSVDVPLEVDRELVRARLEDGIGPTVRLRLLARLWARDERVRGQVVELARTEGDTERLG